MSRSTSPAGQPLAIIGALLQLVPLIEWLLAILIFGHTRGLISNPAASENEALFILLSECCAQLIGIVLIIIALTKFRYRAR